jgi:glyoxalase family protein
MTSEPTLPGIHHITAIAGDPQRNIDFYMGLLALRLVKKTVNFDDPGSYHFYYGDDIGRPGTIMTFFAWPSAPRGRVGAGQVGVTSFSIPAGALDFWRERLTSAGVPVTDGGRRWGDRILSFEDPDALPLELIAASEGDDRPGWADGSVPAEYAIRGFHAPTLYVRDIGPSERVLTEVMGFRRAGEEGGRVRFAAGEGRPGEIVDLLARPELQPWQAAGTVHHIAWRTPDDAQELAWREDLLRNGLHVTEVRDRTYFHSIYYREPGAILYEIATDQPGFAVDEAPEALGTALKLPSWLESRRAQIERALPPVHLPAGVAREVIP